ncbi:MAG: cellulase family glycosylhydrolase, partial [Victivallales bacterium]|nr:cellulase family glycosylhydrolase [Victivallales bacterium]
MNGDDALDYSVKLCAKKGIPGHYVALTASLPSDYLKELKIIADRKNIGFERIYNPQKWSHDGAAKTLSIKLAQGVLVVSGPLRYRLQDNRKYKKNSFGIRIILKHDIDSGNNIIQAEQKLSFQFIPHASIPVNIEEYANMGFEDQKENDGKGGWTDQGSANDLKGFPVGKRKFEGILFQITDPENNFGKSCIVLKGRARPSFPQKQEVILKKPQAAKFLYILHATAWTPPAGEKVGTVAVEYDYVQLVEKEQSTKDIISGTDVGNFWTPKDMTNGKVVWKGNNLSSTVGLYMSRIELNGEKVKKIILTSTNSAVWMIVGLTLSDILTEQPVINAKIIREDQNYVSFPTQMDMDIKPGSILDFSYMLDAPSGKYDFVKSVGDHFEFENAPGKNVRFYGVNIAQGLHFMNKENTRRMLARIAAMGYNIIRLHHFDKTITVHSQSGSFNLNAEYMDKIDFLISECKKMGLYITLDLFTSRNILPGEIQGTGNRSFSSPEYKALMFVHEPAMKNFENHAKILLTHTNPYTGLAWKDDPSIAMLSLVNENTITVTHKASKFISEMYDSKFYEYLKEKNISANTENMEQLWIKFLSDIYKRAFYRMRNFIDEMDIKFPITDQNYYTNIATTLMRKEYDYVDIHFYNSHPVYLGKHHNVPLQVSNAYMTELLTGSLKNMFTARLYHKPFSISEWDFVSPNEYNIEGAFLTGAYAAAQDWTALCRFCFGFGEWTMKQQSPLIHNFAIANDPLRCLSERTAVLFFLRRDVKASTRNYPIVILKDYIPKNHSEYYPDILKNLGFLGKTGTLIVDSQKKFILPENTSAAIIISKSTNDTINTTLPLLSVEQAKNKLDLSRNIFTNDTGQLNIDSANGKFIVSTP